MRQLLKLMQTILFVGFLSSPAWAAMAPKSEKGPSVDSSGPSMGGSPSFGDDAPNAPSSGQDSSPNTSAPSKPSAPNRDSAPSVDKSTPSAPSSGKSSSGSSSGKTSRSSGSPSSGSSGGDGSGRESAGPRSSDRSSGGNRDSGGRDNNDSNRSFSGGSGRNESSDGNQKSPDASSGQAEEGRDDPSQKANPNQNDNRDSAADRASSKPSGPKNTARTKFTVQGNGEYLRLSLKQAIMSGALKGVSHPEQIREELKAQGKRMALAVWTPRSVLVRVYVDDPKIYVAEIALGTPKYAIIPKKPAQYYKAGLTLYFDSLEDALKMLTKPNFFSDELLKKKDYKAYIKNLTTGQVYEHDFTTGRTREINPKDIPPGQLIDGVFEEGPDLLSLLN